MRRALITALIAAIVLVVILDIGLIARKYAVSDIDLREPIYLVIDKSFFSGCEYDPEKEEDCRKTRIKAINDGADDWFEHFNPTTRPKVVIVYSKADLPFSPINNPIYVKLEEKTCGLTSLENTAAACYRALKPYTPMIIFNTANDITSGIFAHELGHALGRSGKHNDVPKNVYSVMSYPPLDSNRVLPIDIKILCEMHPECPPHEDTWCEGGFWDKDLCPSSSYEEGEEMFKANHPAP